MKTCSKCKIEKELTEYRKGKYRNICKECQKKADAIYRENNKEKRKEYYQENKETIKEKSRLYYDENKDVILSKIKDIDEDIIKERKKKYYNNNKEKVSLYKKKYYEENKEETIKRIKERYNELKNNEEFIENNKEIRKRHRKNNKDIINQRRRERKINDPLYKLTESIRTLISISVKKMGFTKNSKTKDILGCLFDEFKIYIEVQFTEGMSWDNHGEWHLDHKIPVSWAKTEEEVYLLNNYENFQPLWANENLSKGNRYSH